MEAKGSDEVEKIKTKVRSAWHNMKYSWVLKTKTYFSRSSPVFLLGKCYHLKAEDVDALLPQESTLLASNSDSFSGYAEEFRKDFFSKIWLTYRQDFPQIEGSPFTTDCGWGCTLRTSQMLFAQGLVLHFLGRGWTWSEALQIESSDIDSWTANAARKLMASLESSLQRERDIKSLSSDKSTPQKSRGTDNDETEMYHRKIISWFADSPSSVFGLHRLIEYGKKSDKVAGDWYGPAVVAHLMRTAAEEATDPELQGITVYVAQDCTVYSADVLEKLQLLPGSEKDSKAAIILVPVRLGGEKTNPEYLEFVKEMLSLEYCIGIIGGKPKQSYYFVGFQDDSLIYMDPHYCQSFVDVSIKEFPLESFHCPSPKKMAFAKMDPSCTIGFYCKGLEDFEKISEEITQVLNSSPREKYPLFTFIKGHAKDYDFALTPVPEQSGLFFDDESETLTHSNTDEFVLL